MVYILPTVHIVCHKQSGIKACIAMKYNVGKRKP